MNEAADNKCRVCGEEVSPKLDRVSAGTGESFEILICSACGHGRTSPQPTDLDKYYSGYYGGRHGFTARFRAMSRARILNHCFNRIAGRSVLDVGCGDGDFMLAARGSGWVVVGTERSEQIGEITGLDVLPDLIAVQKVFGDASFDAITCWHTLEHFDDPAAPLDEIGKLIKTDGVLLIAVPNFGGWQSRFFGRHWLHLDVPRHLSHFTSDSLDQLFSKHGFKVERSWHSEFEYDVLGWSQSGLNAIFPTPNAFFHLLSGKPTKIGSFSKIVNFALGSLFSAVSLPFVLFGSLARKGGTLVVKAVKVDNSTQI
ncbi:MAG: class I SAM-dependent methyltransferase [Pyrinomonadaceae bacterium]|nr:class I SAM-dependent methyltransferase [Pyrinomonadaceae bacterium]